MSWENSFSSLAEMPRMANPAGSSYGSVGKMPALSFANTSSNWASSFSVAKPKQTKYQPAAFPEAMSLTIPFSSMASKPFTAQADTTGDILGSLGASLNNSLWQNGYLNLANAISWAEERAFVGAMVLADEAAKGEWQTPWNTKVPANFRRPLGDSPLGDATRGFADVIKAVAEPVAKVMEAIPNFVRDTQLHQRTSAYRALVTGKAADPTDFLGNFLTGAGLAFGMDPYNFFNLGKFDSKTNPLAQTAASYAAPGMSPAERAMWAAMVDLPDDVKRRIEENPDGDFGKYLDDSEQGRQFTYSTNQAVNLYTNLGNVGTLYAIELIAASRLGTRVRIAGEATQNPYLSKALEWTGSGISKAATIQKFFLATGLNYFPLSTLADVALRTMGNKEGVAYLDRMNRTTLISDSPAVQLVSSFSVNPIAAMKLAAKGQLKFLGSPLVAVDLATGRRFSTLYNHDTVVLDRIAEMYNTTRAGAAERIGPGRTYETKGAAYNEVLNLAADSFIQKLPESTKSIINALPFGQRTVHLFTRYANQILDEVEKPLGMIARWRRDWPYHRLYGEFDPEVAGHISVDYRGGMLKTAMAREELDLVQTYPTLLNPEGQQIVAAKIEAVFANGRQGTLRDLNTLSVDHPALNGLVDDLVAKGRFAKPKDVVPREVFDEALARATTAWDDAKLSPFRTATGGDPILRPTARPAEWADALGTTEDTIEALSKGAGRTPAQDALVGSFLREKNLATEAELAAGMTDDLWLKGNDYMNTTTEPWVARGADVASAEARSAVVGERLNQLERDRLAGVPVSHDEMMGARDKYNKLQSLLSDVRDPGVPYAATLKFAERPEARAVAEARRVLEAREKLAVVRGVQEAIAPVPVFGTNDLLRSVEKVGGSWQWVADRWTTSGPLFDAAVSEYKAWAFKGKVNRQRLRQFENGTPPAGQFKQMAESDRFLRMLRGKGDEAAVAPEVYGAERPTVTFRQIADEIEAGTARGVETQITQEMWEALGVGNREDFIARLGTLREAYDAALDGTTPYLLGRTAGKAILEWAAEQARVGKLSSVFRDPAAEQNYANALVALKNALDSGNLPGARLVVEGNPLLLAQARREAMRNGQLVGEFLANPKNAATLLPAPGAMPEPWAAGLPKALTELDEVMLANDLAKFDELKINLDDIRGTPAPPLKGVPIEAVNALAAAPRLSATLAADLNAAGIHWVTRIPEELWAKSDVGARALSFLESGRLDRRPQTIMGLLDSLKQIENGNAANAKMGAQVAAEAQRLGETIVRDMIGDMRRAGIERGVLGMGEGLNPYTWAEDTYQMFKRLYAQDNVPGGGVAVFRDDLGLQYGLGARPRGKINPKTGELEGQAVSVDISTEAGLAEELLMGRFQPTWERTWTVRAQHAFERLFTLSNQKIMYEARGRFEKQLAAYGIPANVAEKIWTAWRTFAKESRGEQWLGKSWRKSARVAKGKVPSSSALYATEKNIPNNKLEDIATKVLEEHYERLGGVPEELNKVWFSEEMRIAGSFTRRQLQKVPVMGDFLQHAYGTFAHNEWVTTRYFIFRFMLDPRFHLMNKGEGMYLDWGRGLLKQEEIDKPMFGLDMRSIRAVGEIDTMSDVGYPFAVTRDARILRLTAKEQPDVLRGVVANDPALFRKAMVELAKIDPELSVTIPKMGHTPDQWLKALDTEWGKIMRSADPEDVLGATIQREIDAAPALSEVYGRIYDANVKLIGDLKAMMYGNPNRGQIERVANSFLLYWPISYQLKATKWLLNILYGKIGGIQTGGLGAVALDRVQAEHERRIAEDPEYSRFFEENQALVFAAQMMVPITPAGIGVSLSPIWRNLFFPTSKKVLEIGPVYTVNGFLPSVSGNLYQYLKDVPGAAVAYKAATGWQPPKDEEAAWPEGWAKPAP